MFHSSASHTTLPTGASNSCEQVQIPHANRSCFWPPSAAVSTGDDTKISKSGQDTALVLTLAQTLFIMSVSASAIAVPSVSMLPVRALASVAVEGFLPFLAHGCTRTEQTRADTPLPIVRASLSGLPDTSLPKLRQEGRTSAPVP